MIKLSILYLIFTLSFAVEGRSAAGEDATEDDGLCFHRVLRNFIGKTPCVASLAASAASSSIPHMKRLLILDTPEQLEFMAKKLSGVSFDVLVLGAFHERSHEVAKLCNIAGSGINMLGRKRYGAYVARQQELGEHRASEAKFGYSITDVTAIDHYDVVLMVGEMDHVMPAYWYHSRILRALKFGGYVYFMDVLKADWDLSCYGWKKRFIGTYAGRPTYGLATHGFHHFESFRVERPDKDNPDALVRSEPSVDISASGLPPVFSSMKYVDVFNKGRLVIAEAPAEGKGP